MSTMSARANGYGNKSQTSHRSDMIARSASWSHGLDDASPWEDLDRNRRNARTPGVNLDKALPPTPQSIPIHLRASESSALPGSSNRRANMPESRGRGDLGVESLRGDEAQLRTSQLKPAKDLRLAQGQYPDIPRPRTAFEAGVGTSTVPRGASEQHPEILRPGTAFQGAVSTPMVTNKTDDQDVVTMTDRVNQYLDAITSWPFTITTKSVNRDSGAEVDHPDALRPGSVPPSMTPKENSSERTSERSSLPRFIPRKPSYVETTLDTQPSPSPVPIYSAYRPPEARGGQSPRIDAVPAPVSPSETAITHYRDADKDNEDAPTMALSRTPRLTEPTSSRQRSNAISSPSAMTFVDGVLFEMMSPPITPNLPPASTPIPIPVPTPISTPIPIPIPSPPASSRGRGRGRGRQVSTTSTRNPSRSPSPAYGSWSSDRPRQTRRSFFSRTQARIENSVNERLIKAGLRAPPSFKVLKVEKSLTSTAAMVHEEQKRISLAESPSAAAEAEKTWRARMERLQRRGEVENITVGEPARLAAPKPRRKPSWEISSDEGEDEDETEMGMRMGTSVPARKPVPPAVARNRPRLSIDTSVGSGAPGDTGEVQGMSNSSIPTPPKNMSDANDLSSSRCTRNRTDSLFLGSGDSGSTQSSSFFASEYARKQLAASNMERNQIEIAPSAEPSEKQVGQEERESNMKADSSAREQRLHLPIDDRRNLPSQTQRRTLVKKKGMQLRKATC